MTENQEQIIKEIKLYQERMGRWPNISDIAKLRKVKQPTMTKNIRRMVESGYVQYLGRYIRGQSRKVKPCDL